MTSERYTLAVLRREGYTHLQVRCGACCRTSFIPLGAFAGNIDRTVVDDIAPRLRCRSCGRRPPPDLLAMPWHPNHFSFQKPEDHPYRRWIKHGAPLIPRGITQDEWASYSEQERNRIRYVKNKDCGWL